ncbi:MAG: M48 family metalloprotease [Candidatus Dependentiae bacterium]|nr:M48 family metalloprotease [Candidatus Dependentiae bacterium]
MIIIGLFHAPISAMKWDYDIDQESAKNQTFFTDGISVAQVEQSLRDKHGLAIPEKFLFINNIYDILGNKMYMGAAYSAGHHSILLERDMVNRSNSRAATWLLSHETGHAQMPNVTSTIIPRTQLAINIATAYFWGAHKAKPYKHFSTKVYSKFMASALAGLVFNSASMRLEERRADNWANKNSDEKTLQGGIEFLQDAKALQQKHWSKGEPFSPLGFSIAQQFMDLTHPSCDSRIAKIQKELDKRADLKV